MAFSSLFLLILFIFYSCFFILVMEEAWPGAALLAAYGREDIALPGIIRPGWQIHSIQGMYWELFFV